MVDAITWLECFSGLSILSSHCLPLHTKPSTYRLSTCSVQQDWVPVMLHGAAMDSMALAVLMYCCCRPSSTLVVAPSPAPPRQDHICLCSSLINCMWCCTTVQSACQSLSPCQEEPANFKSSQHMHSRLIVQNVMGAHGKMMGRYVLRWLQQAVPGIVSSD